MPDTYGVLPSAIAGELPGLFNLGFSPTTRPSVDQVTSLITTADTIVTLQVQTSAGALPAMSDRATPLAQRYIIEYVKAQVVRIVYSANDPAQVKAAADAYSMAAADAMNAIIAMGAQAAGAQPEPDSRVGVPSGLPDRCLVVNDCDLGRDVFRSRF